MTWLFLDVNNLAWRAYHTTGTLRHGHVWTGVTFGILREIAKLRERFQPDRVCFCFDSPRSLRAEAVPSYKAARRKREAAARPEERANRRAFLDELEALRTDYLLSLGHANIWQQDGYEADDLIAAGLTHLKGKGRAVIVSTDRDLYQLLSDRVSLWKPRPGVLYTVGHFRTEFDLEPENWPLLKALAGCATDGVEGIKGIGEKTAARYLAGTLPRSSRLWERIDGPSGECRGRMNLPLVTLPYAGCSVPIPQPDRPSVRAWRELCKRLGFTSLEDRAFAGRR